jgi:hypothetical protein
MSSMIHQLPHPTMKFISTLWAWFMIDPSFERSMKTVDGVYSYQTSIGLASGQFLRRNQGTLLPSSVNPRYLIRGTNV